MLVYEGNTVEEKRKKTTNNVFVKVIESETKTQKQTSEESGLKNHSMLKQSRLINQR